MTRDSKVCAKCRQTKPLSEFHKRADGHGLGIRHICKGCTREANKSPGRAEQRRNATRKWQGNNPAYFKDNHKVLREGVLKQLGGACECCGESQYEFLAIDHRHGGGIADRKGRSGGSFLRKVIKEGCPKDKYRVLCHNCNSAHGFYGYCPHQSLVSKLFKKIKLEI
jgi:hypothetical protein